MVSWFIERAVRTDGCTRAPRVCRISWYRPRRLRQWSAAVHTVQPEPLSTTRHTSLEDSRCRTMPAVRTQWGKCSHVAQQYRRIMAAMLNNFGP